MKHNSKHVTEISRVTEGLSHCSRDWVTARVTSFDRVGDREACSSCGISSRVIWQKCSDVSKQPTTSIIREISKLRDKVTNQQAN